MLRQILFEMKITFKSIKTMIYMIFVFLYTLTILFGTAAKDTGILTYQQALKYELAYLKSYGMGDSPYANDLISVGESLEQGDAGPFMKIKINSDFGEYEMWEMAFLQLSEKGRADWFKGAFDDRQTFIDLRKEFGRETPDYELPFNYLNYLTGFWFRSSSAKFYLKYDYELYKSKEVPGTAYRVDAMTSLMHYQGKVLPNIMAVIVILLLMDSMYRDFDNGTIKMLITLPKDRSRYIIVKLISSVLSSLVVIILPIFVIFAGLFVKHGFSSANYPVLANLDGITSTKLEFAYSELYKEIGVSNYRPVPFGISQTVEGVYDVEYTLNGILYTKLPSLTSNIIPLWQLIVISVLPIFACQIFYCCFGIMMSVLIRNRNGFVAVTTVLLGISLGIESLFFGQGWTMFNPMSLSNGLALVQGIKPNTAFSAITVLPIYSLICIVIAINYFKKLDIH